MATIAVAGFLHETNTFAPRPADFAAFAGGGGRPPFSTGGAMLAAVKGHGIGLAGFVVEAERLGHRVVPLLWCETSPCAPVTRDAYERIAGMIVESFRHALATSEPPTALYLDLGGAMVTEHLDDGEGELLGRLRAVAGTAMPFVASLDLHANVSEAMVALADVMVAYRTYPHVDRAETGARAAQALDRVLMEGRPAKAWRRVPFLIPLTWQCTLDEPMASIYRRLHELETSMVIGLSFVPGFPLADVPDAGPSVLAYVRSQAAADVTADTLAQAVTEREGAFQGRLWPVEEAVVHAISRSRVATRPVILADTQDNPGAGGNADSTGALQALVRHGANGAVVAVMCDPEVAVQAHAAGVGAEIEVSLGAKAGWHGDGPFRGRVVVERLGDGDFAATGAFYRGWRMSLGPMALLRIGGVRVVVASRKQQAGDQAMLRHLGVEPARQKILVLKSSVHFRADFAPIADEILVVEASGPIVVDQRKLNYRRLRPGLRVAPLGPAFASPGA